MKKAASGLGLWILRTFFGPSLDRVMACEDGADASWRKKKKMYKKKKVRQTQPHLAQTPISPNHSPYARLHHDERPVRLPQRNRRCPSHWHHVRQHDELDSLHHRCMLPVPPCPHASLKTRRRCTGRKGGGYCKRGGRCACPSPFPPLSSARSAGC